MREPVRTAPPPPLPVGRPATISRGDTAQPITKRSVLAAVGPARPARGPAPAQPARAGVRPPPKKKPPPRPPPPKFQEFSRRAPPTYEQVLQEDAAVLAGFGFGGERSATAAAAAPPLGTDLIDFNAPATAPPLPQPSAPLTWDSPPPARRTAAAVAAPGPAAAAAAAAPLPAVTVIRPAKSAARRPRPTEAPPAPAADRDASPPMPSCPPPPPPPAVGWVSETPTVRPPTPPPRPGSSASATQPPQATALYDFQSADPSDLSFEAGDTIQLLGRVNTEWLRGSCGLRRGIFPEAYVRVTVPLPGEPEPEPEPEPEQTAHGALVLYDFVPQEATDLALTAGELVQVQGRINEEWGYGSVAGRSGQFPLAFVDVQAERLALL